MAKWQEVQRDFSGGEVSQRMFMRDDLEAHGKSLLTMENFMPTLQGSAVRTPGTRFLWEIVDSALNVVDSARILPYITPDNRYALVEIIPQRDTLPGEIRVRQNVEAAVNGLPLSGPADPDNTYTAFKRIVTNDSFANGFDGWTAVPNEYEQDEKRLGWWDSPGQLTCRPRATKDGNAIETCTLTTTAIIPEATDQLQIAPYFRYALNTDDSPESKFTGTISVGTTAGASDIWTFDFSEFNVGDVYDRVDAVPVTLAANDVIHLTFTITALYEDSNNSTPTFVITQFRVLSKETIDIESETVALNNTTVSYTAAELQDLQFVQSPYFDSGTLDGLFGNEIVMVHPNHPPKRLYFNGGQYVFGEIPFEWVNEDGDASPLTPEPGDTYWSTGNYPAACSSFLGRLVLAGGNKNPIPGSLTGSTTERVWMTYVGKWTAFSDPAADITPASSIEFTSTYRSPIQWVHGQSNLLIGSESFEYVSNSDGIYAPGDLGVFLQSTHGSDPVQPVPMGQYVLFAAEQGSRVRAMQYVAESEYWVAPDMTIWHPDLFARNGGIKRMVRMRNPHQMCVCVMGNGQLGVLHQDSYTNISGWSRMILGNQVKDAAVLAQSNGTDILYMLVKRNVNGAERLYLEAIGDWTYREENNWGYLRSAVTYIPDTAGNVITGLDHLENKIVQVVSDRSYIGSYRVQAGQITMVDGTGAPIDVSNALVGMAHGGRIRTMPLISEDPASRKRYASLYVRCRNSSRPKINDVRPPDRDPQRITDEAQDLDIIQDYEDENFGWNRTQVITVSEEIPVRVEVLGIFGRVQGNDL